MLELFRKHFKKHSSEVVSVPTCSPFVLIQDGQKKRLAYGETISLNPGTQVLEDDKIESFLVHPNAHSLSLMIRWKSGYYVSPIWKLTDSIDPDTGRKEKKNEIGLMPVAFTSRDGKSYIKGSSIYFDQQEMRLHGDGWTVEYKQL